MRKPPAEVALALIIAITIHAILLILLVSFGSGNSARTHDGRNLVQVEGAGGAASGIAAGDFAALGAPDEILARCIYTPAAQKMQLDTSATPKNNPAFLNCPETIRDLKLSKPFSGTFNFHLRHRRPDGFEVVESTGDEAADSAIVTSVMAQNFSMSATLVVPERVAFLVEIRAQ